MTKSCKADVAVIGAGISGALTAYYLMNSGVDVVVVDKRHPGLGSTCASTSILDYELDTGLVELSERIGFSNAVACYLLCVDSIYQLKRIAEGLDIYCEFEERPCLYIATRKSDVRTLEKEYKARKRAGIMLDLLTAAELKKEFSFGAQAALLSQDGAQMDSFLFTHGLLQHIVSKGGKVHGHTEIVKTTAGKSGIELVTDKGLRIRAKRCVYADGYESLQHITPPLTQVQSTFAVISEPVEENPVNYILWETARPYFYMRSTRDNRIMIGGKDELFYDPVKRDKLIAVKAKELVKVFNRLYPSVRFKPDFKWAGTFASTQDGLPFIGVHPQYPHAYFALGFGGNGITFGLVAAQIIHDLFHKRPNTHAALFSFYR